MVEGGDKTATKVAIVGAGIVGICAAIALRKDGYSVTLIDRLPPGDACSFGNAGILSSWSIVPEAAPGIMRQVPAMLFNPEGPLALRWSYLPQLAPWLMRFFQNATRTKVEATAKALLELHGETVPLYQRLAQEAGLSHLVKTSDCLHVFKRARDLKQNGYGYDVRRRFGAQLTYLQGGEIQEIEPEVSPTFTQGVLMSPQGHTVNPGALAKGLAAYFTKRGGEIVNADVTAVAPRSGGGARLTTSSGDIDADRLVIAAGSWSAQLAAPLLAGSNGKTVKMPLEAERGYHMVFANPGISLRRPVMEGGRRVFFTSMEMGLRAAGTVEFAGLDQPPNDRRSSMLAGIAHDIFPNLQIGETSTWMGQRPAFPDSLPMIGALPGLPDIVMATGHGHTGLTAAPRTAELVAHLVARRSPNVDMQPYKVERF